MRDGLPHRVLWPPGPRLRRNLSEREAVEQATWPGLDGQFQDEPHFCGALGTPTVSDLPCFRANSVPVIKHMGGGGGEGDAFNVVLFLHKQTPMHTLSLATGFLSFLLTFFR